MSEKRAPGRGNVRAGRTVNFEHCLIVVGSSLVVFFEVMVTGLGFALGRSAEDLSWSVSSAILPTNFATTRPNFQVCNDADKFHNHEATLKKK